MTTYVLRRLLLIVPTLLGVSVITFSFVRLLPGDAVTAMATDFETDLDTLRRELGLDVPYHKAYLTWLLSVAQGDFGTSLRDRQSVSRGVAQHLPTSIELALLATVISVVIALPVGVLAAVVQQSPLDYVARVIATLLTAVPFFWTAVLILTWASIWFGWSPRTEYRQLWQDPFGNLQQMFLPALVLGTAITGVLMRVARTEMLEVYRQDYIRTARAKGLQTSRVVMRHALRNALLPIVTVIGLQVPLLIGGTVIAETLFVLPGMGRYLFNALNHRDYPIVQAATMLIALVVSISNLVVDVTYSYLDPRVRLR
jgi:peptide/nickel transport system permease protein